MEPCLAIIIWIVIIILVFAIMYYMGYSCWASIVLAALVGLIAFVIVFPWFFPEHHHRHEESCISEDESERHSTMFIFFAIVALSVLILLAYIIGCIFDVNDACAESSVVVVPASSTVTVVS